MGSDHWYNVYSYRTSKNYFDMGRMAFTMKLHPGRQEEYKMRHDRIWPELTRLLHENGIREYSIYLDEDTCILFGVLQIADASAMQSLRTHPVMRKWWDHMKDIMDTHPDGEPVSHPLKEVFYLP